jgi:hypothetical protein
MQRSRLIIKAESPNHRKRLDVMLAALIGYERKGHDRLLVNVEAGTEELRDSRRHIRRIVHERTANVTGSPLAP